MDTICEPKLRLTSLLDDPMYARHKDLAEGEGHALAKLVGGLERDRCPSHRLGVLDHVGSRVLPSGVNEVR